MKTWEAVAQFIFLLIIAAGVKYFFGEEWAKIGLLAMIVVNVAHIKLALYEIELRGRV